MQRKVSYLFILPALLAAAACKNSVVGGTSQLYEPFKSNPVTITWNGKADQGVESFEADVEVHTLNNRTDVHAQLRDKYRLAVKTIAGWTFVRLDFPADEAGGIAARSMLSNGSEMIIFDPKTEVIEQRIALDNPNDPSFDFLKGETAVSRLNLKMIRAEASRLAFDMDDNKETGLLTLNLPPNLLGSNADDRLISSRVSFDTHTDTLHEAETVHIREDGTKITTNTIVLYEDKDGEPVKVGSVTEITCDNPNKITGISEDVPIYNSEDDIPKLSQAEHAALQEQGTVVPNEQLIFGDPGDLSYKETVVEVYQDIGINTAQDTLFKLLLQ